VGKAKLFFPSSTCFHGHEEGTYDHCCRPDIIIAIIIIVIVIVVVKSTHGSSIDILNRTRDWCLVAHIAFGPVIITIAIVITVVVVVIIIIINSIAA
jgi:hypothetical protein